MPGIFHVPKKRPGDASVLPAEAVNALLDVARDYKGGGLSPDLPERTATDDMSTVVVRNDTGDALPQFSVVMLGEPLFDPSGGDAALAAFKLFPRFKALVPVLPDAIGYFGITLEPIAADEQGTACIAGVVPVQVWVTNESDWFAEASDNITYCLTSGPTGNAQVLWKQPGTGLVWAIVRLQPGPSFIVFEAEIHATGPHGEPDFDDERYWVREENPLGGTTDPNDPDYGTVLYNYQGGYWGPATNLAEYGYTPHTHYLAGGEVVRRVLVFGRMDLAGNWCYQFRESGACALLDGQTHTDTVQHDPVAGDMIYATDDDPPVWDALAVGAGYSILTVSAAGLPAWFAKGADGKVLRMTGGALVWGDPPPVRLLDGSQHSDTTAHVPAEGDIIYGTAAGKWEAYGIGADNSILTAWNGVPDWFAAGAAQSILYVDGNGDLAWLGHGTDKQVLTSTGAGGTIGWADPPAPTGYTGVKIVLTGAALDGNTVSITNESWSFENGILKTIDANPPIILDGTDCNGG